MGDDGGAHSSMPIGGRNTLFALVLGLTLLVKLTVVGVGVFTGYYTVAVLALALAGGVVIWGVVIFYA
ncbi:hypothetical protein [Natrinema caseinilyticum]|uniref:hypothetical protein n=1 Tax=Natrinema caseinilyticum TaxID=2961570 RepID=UPI0020C5148B|nr:hypothetical protein [Natrinema caseinilyticum]